MKKYVLLGILFFIVVVLVRMPASIVSTILDNHPKISLVDARGTIWQGQGHLLVDGNRLGIAQWSLSAWSILTFSPSAEWMLEQNFATLSGDAIYSWNELQLSANGMVQAEAFNPFLVDYDIDITGDFKLDGVVANVDTNRESGSLLLNRIEGDILWSGGIVKFTLAGLLQEEILPSLITRLDSNEGLPNATVFEVGANTPLMMFAQGAPGFIKVSITKRFTQLLNRPWPGSAADHEIVVEVEEQFPQF